MRLWHKDLIPYLPKQQLVAQWRELNSIYVKEDKHILINFIYEYSPYQLLIYSQLVIKEMRRRGYKCNLEKYNNYFLSKGIDEDDLKLDTMWFCENPFSNHMNYTYLLICCWNLYEKYIRGQEGFTEESIKFIKEKL